MFKNIWKNGDAVNGPYFEEVVGPWKQNFEATAVVVADLNQDGLDDIIVCSANKPFFFVQNTNGTWTSVNLPNGNNYVQYWRNVRVGDFTGDGVSDIVVAKSGEWKGGFFIFKGTGQGVAPYFDFNSPFLDVKLPYATPDIEMLDINDDGLWDLYVVQTDESRERDIYCAKVKALYGPVTRWWGGVTIDPPPLWVPPLDEAQDVLFIANEDGETFERVTMTHAYPGCGGMVKKFGNNRTLALFQGTFVHPGYHLLLQW